MPSNGDGHYIIEATSIKIVLKISRLQSNLCKETHFLPNNTISNTEFSRIKNCVFESRCIFVSWLNEISNWMVEKMQTESENDSKAWLVTSSRNITRSLTPSSCLRAHSLACVHCSMCDHILMLFKFAAIVAANYVIFCSSVQVVSWMSKRNKREQEKMYSYHIQFPVWT